MELTIKEKVENKSLARTDIVARMHYQGVTPSRKDVQAEIAKATKGKPELTIIRSIKNNFGDSSATIEAAVYTDEKLMQANERKNLIAKHAGHEPKSEEEEAA